MTTVLFLSPLCPESSLVCTKAVTGQGRLSQTPSACLPALPLCSLWSVPVSAAFSWHFPPPPALFPSLHFDLSSCSPSLTCASQASFVSWLASQLIWSPWVISGTLPPHRRWWLHTVPRGRASIYPATLLTGPTGLIAGHLPHKSPTGPHPPLAHSSGPQPLSLLHLLARHSVSGAPSPFRSSLPQFRR